jgi:hypothetical protein
MPARGVQVKVLSGAESQEKLIGFGGRYEFEVPQYSQIRLLVTYKGRSYIYPESGSIRIDCDGSITERSVKRNIALPFDGTIPIFLPTPSPVPTQSPSQTPTPTATPTQTPAPSPEASETSTPKPSPVASPTLNVTPSPSGNPSPSEQNELDKKLAHMKQGNIAFNVPPVMSLDQTYLIALNLSLAKTSDELKDELRDKGVTGDLKTDRISVDSNMQAILTGDGFAINPVTADKLPISANNVTEWKWDVRPIKSGTLRLHVVINALVDLNDGTGRQPYPVKSFDKEYDVAVPWKNRFVFAFIGNNWQWLWATIVIPVGGLWWNRHRKKKGKAGFV